MEKIPLNDSIILSLSRLFSDEDRDRIPTHSDIKSLIDRHNLIEGDPLETGIIGKRKRIQKLLLWAYDNKTESGEKFAYSFIMQVKGCGGFRKDSPNYVGHDAVKDLIDSLKTENIILNDDGTIRLPLLDNLSGKELTKALRGYVDRAKKGFEDGALILGTSKDLLEAVSGHILVELNGSYDEQLNFPNLLIQAFMALGMSTSPTGTPRDQLEGNLFLLACSINRFRNKQGVGHGHPFIPDLSDTEAKTAIESMGIIADYMLDKLNIQKTSRGKAV